MTTVLLEPEALCPTQGWHSRPQDEECSAAGPGPAAPHPWSGTQSFAYPARLVSDGPRGLPRPVGPTTEQTHCGPRGGKGIPTLSEPRSRGWGCRSLDVRRVPASRGQRHLHQRCGLCTLKIRRFCQLRGVYSGAAGHCVRKRATTGKTTAEPPASPTKRAALFSGEEPRVSRAACSGGPGLLGDAGGPVPVGTVAGDAPRRLSGGARADPVLRSRLRGGPSGFPAAPGEGPRADAHRPLSLWEPGIAERDRPRLALGTSLGRPSGPLRGTQRPSEPTPRPAGDARRRCRRPRRGRRGRVTSRAPERNRRAP